MTWVTGKTPATGCPQAPGAGESKGHRGKSCGKRVSNCCRADAHHSGGMERDVPSTEPQPSIPPRLGTPQPWLSIGFWGIHCFSLGLTQAVGSAAFPPMVVQNISLLVVSEVLLLGPWGWFCFRSPSCQWGVQVAPSCCYCLWVISGGG